MPIGRYPAVAIRVTFPMLAQTTGQRAYSAKRDWRNDIQQEARPIGTTRLTGVLLPSTQTSIGTQAERGTRPIANGKPVYLPTVPLYAKAGVRSRHASKPNRGNVPSTAALECRESLCLRRNCQNKLGARSEHNRDLLYEGPL